MPWLRRPASEAPAIIQTRDNSCSDHAAYRAGDMEQSGSEYIVKVEPTKFPSGKSSLAGTAGRMKLTSTEMGKMVEKTGCGLRVSNSLQGAGGGYRTGVWTC